MKDIFKYENVYQDIVHDIENGILHDGDKLPSIRVLSKQYKLSRTTIESAYDKLVLEGYVVAKQKSGYFVTEKEIHLSHELMSHSKTWLYDFSGQSIDEQAFNVTLWKRYIRRALDNGPYLLSYGDYQGEPILREALSSYAYLFRGIHASSQQYVVSAGFRMLLFQLCTLFPRPLRVGMEEGFLLGEQLFLDQHIEVIKIKSKSQGISLEDIENKKIDLLYINPSKSGIHGNALSLKDRHALLKLAYRCHFYLIEDDHNGELRSSSKPLPALLTLDHKDKVIYLGSFSKLLLPSIRLSYMILPNDLLVRYHQCRAFDHQSASKLEQLALAYYIEDGQLSRHLKRLRKYYAMKSHLLELLIQDAFPEEPYIILETALAIGVEFKKISVSSLIEQAKQEGIHLMMNSYHQCLFSYSGMDEASIQKAMAILKKIYSRLS